MSLEEEDIPGACKAEKNYVGDISKKVSLQPEEAWG